MSMTYKENEAGVQIPQVTYPDNKPLGRFGKIAVENLKNRNRSEYVIKMMDGSLMSYGHEMEQKMWNRISELENQYEQQAPLTKEQQKDLMTATKIRNQYRQQATEVAMKELLN
ncbi:TnpV protein [Enterococcus faecalis]|uniref:TnpV protein n=3 Tax=Enterococcus TaxID=1350 RepID=UPI0019E4E276|nr:TnpV protein [Enterococcus faecalis]